MAATSVRANEDQLIEFHDLAARTRANAQYMLRRFRAGRQNVLAGVADPSEMACVLDRIELRLMVSEAAEAGEMMRLRDLLGRRPPRRTAAVVHAS